MFGFPVSNGNSGSDNFIEKFTNNADSGFPKIQQREVFFTIKTGNWTDPTIWQTVSGRVGVLPTINDDVYVRHNINTAFTANTGVAVNNLFVNKESTITFTGGGGAITLSILGNLQCLGTLNGSGGQFHFIRLYGTDNRIDNWLSSSNSDIVYNRNGDQNIIPNLPYYNLWIEGSGTKYLISDLVLLGNLRNVNTTSVIECGAFNLTVNGSTVLNYFSKNNSGNLLFIGNLQLTGNNAFGIRLTGNPDVELRGGLTINSLLSFFDSGIGTWRFTTNNQILERQNAGSVTFNCPFTIDPGITVTANTNSNSITFNNTINGLSATSKLLQNTNSIINFGTQNAAENSMVTGIFDITTNANTIQYFGNYSATIPSRFPTFSSLTIGGTGTKTLGINTTLNGNLSVQGGGTLDFGTYNIDVIGTSTVQGNTSTLKKTGAGSLLFRGQFGFLNASTNNVTIDFSLGNPNVELRGGIAIVDGSVNTFKTGTGTWTFSTNNQFITNNMGPVMTFDCTLVISGAINISVNGSQNVRLNQPINGTVAGSTLTNVTNLWFGNSITSMSTGVFDFTTNLNNIVGYVYNGSGVLPFTSFRGLYIAGTGTKTVSGNLTVNYNLVINAGILDLTTYNLVVVGTTSFQGNGTFAKTGAGNILFTGLVTQSAGSALFLINLSGNPTVELRNGINLSDGNISTGSTSGTGQWTFTTNNQLIYGSTLSGGNGQVFFQCPILISGAITVTLNNGTSFNGLVNGDNASSTFRMGAVTLTYKSPTQPMATGILDTSTNLNTWIYGLNNQNIKGGPTTLAKQVYRNLTLNGGGTKTLQGYVSVLNTYTLTAPATLALNGFTLTNP